MRELLISRLMERMAWRSSMKFECGVWCEKGAVTKKVVFSSTNIASRKRAFNIDNGGVSGGKFGREAEAENSCSPREV
jgi:hypothetical protein